MVIEELLVALGFEFDDSSKKELKEFNEGLANSTKILGGMVAALGAGTAALFGFTKVMADSLDTLGKSARLLEIPAQTLDEIKFGLDQVVGSSQGAEEALLNLARTTGDFDNLDQTLMRILEEANQLDELGRIEFLDAMGLGNFSLAARDLDAFRTSLEKARGLSLVSAEDVANAEEFNDTLTEVLRSMKEISVVILSSLAPSFTEIMKEFTDWVQLNKEFLKEDISATFKTIGEALSIIFDFMRKVSTMFLKVVKSLGGFNRLLKVSLAVLSGIAALGLGKLFLFAISSLGKVSMLLTAINAKALLIPTAIGALLAAAFLIGQDIAVALEGGDSVIGRFIDSSPKLIAFLKEASDWISKIADSLKSISEFKVPEAFKPFIGGILGQQRSVVPGAMSAFGASRVAPANASTNTSTSTSNMNQKIDITVKGNATGLDTGAVVDGIKEAYRETMRDVTSGINK